MNKQKQTFTNHLLVPILEVEVDLDETHSNGLIPYGSNMIYNIKIFTIPRQLIVPDITRNGSSLAHDPRFELKLM